MRDAWVRPGLIEVVVKQIFGKKGLHHKKFFGFWRYTVCALRKVGEGKVTLKLLSRIILTGNLIPGPEWNCPPTLRDDDKLFAFKANPASFMDYYRTFNLHNHHLKEGTLEIESHCMTNYQLNKRLSELWLDVFDITFSITN